MSRLGASWLLAVMLWIAGCNGSDSTPNSDSTPWAVRLRR